MHLTENPVHDTGGTCAVDINVNNWSLAELTVLLEVARQLGWAIGHGYQIVKGAVQGFVHLDIRAFLKDCSLKQTEFYY